MSNLLKLSELSKGDIFRFYGTGDNGKRHEFICIYKNEYFFCNPISRAIDSCKINFSVYKL